LALLRQVNNPLLFVGQNGELRPKVLQDFKTNNETLSFYMIDVDDKDFEGKLKRIAAALCSIRENVPVFDYVFVPESEFQELGLKIKEDIGTTPDKEVNEWHRNVIVESAYQLVSVARLVARSDPKQMGRDNAIRAVKEGLSNGSLDVSKVNLVKDLNIIKQTMSKLLLDAQRK
jgi:hypothetical protein